MEDKDIINELKTNIEKENVPDSLKPENIMGILGEQIDNENEASNDVIDANLSVNSKQIKKSKKSLLYAVGGLAAAILIVIGIGVGYHFIDNNETSDSENSTNNIFTNNELVQNFLPDNDDDDDSKEKEELFVTENNFKKLLSYSQLKKYIEENNKALGGMTGSFVDMEESVDESFDDMYLEGEITNDGASPDSDTSSDYSDTNVRTEGVLEGDIIKTDGKYIYVLREEYKNSMKLDIVKPDGVNTEYIAEYDLGEIIEQKYNDIEGNIDNCFLEECLVYEEKLVIIVNVTRNYINYFYDTNIIVFDKTDVTNLKEIDCHTVSGYFSQSRMANGYLYITTDMGINKNYIEPMVDGEALECDDVYLTDTEYYQSYTVISTFDMKDETKKIDEIAVAHDGYAELYMSSSSIYLLSSYYREVLTVEDLAFSETYKQHLLIMKFSYVDGEIQPINTTSIEGWLADTFCVDEYNDYLRIVVTNDNNYERVNSLFVLDKQLEKVGYITDIAPGERIYSARFDGDIGYFVTYRQMDPLFSVDLSDPANPQIIGELKIPGFSEYMHMWTDGKMLGIGQEDGEIKLSMFDISDPYNVAEENKCIIANTWYSSAWYEYKSVFIDEDKNIIGFLLEGGIDEYYEEGDFYSWDYALMYQIYSYEEGEFVLKYSVEMGESYNSDIRGMYIGEYIYIVGGYGEIRVLNMDDFSEVKHIEI